jgi:hypothetical protein
MFGHILYFYLFISLSRSLFSLFSSVFIVLHRSPSDAGAYAARLYSGSLSGFSRK